MSYVKKLLEEMEAQGVRACETAPDGTGARCTCSYDCVNYCLRARGFREGMTPDASNG